MKTEEFQERLFSRNARFGLCMFAPAIMSPAANRLLNAAYGDSGDNLSVPLGRIGADSTVLYYGANYSAADHKATRQAIDTLLQIPGAVLLIASAGVGASLTHTLGLLENGRLRVFEGAHHSFYSFAEEFLSVKRLDEPSSIIKPFSDLTVTVSAEILTPASSPQLLLRTPWEAIFLEVTRDPSRLFEFSNDPRGFEEFLADTYSLDGYEVELTPRSADGGVDVIATKKGFGSIKILDQAKAFSEHRVVSANDVRAAYGVLSMKTDASKIVVTTTSNFAPRVFDEFAPFTPTRLELRNGQNLIRWLRTVAEK